MGIRTDHPYIEELKEDFIPAVILDYPLTGKKSTYIESDNIKGCELAIDYLVSRGHERIVFINGHELAAVSYVRRAGYELALKKNGLSFEPELVITANYTESGGYEAVIKFLLRKKRDLQ